MLGSPLVGEPLCDAVQFLCAVARGGAGAGGLLTEQRALLLVELAALGTTSHESGGGVRGGMDEAKMPAHDLRKGVLGLMPGGAGSEGEGNSVRCHTVAAGESGDHSGPRKPLG